MKKPYIIIFIAFIIAALLYYYFVYNKEEHTEIMNDEVSKRVSQEEVENNERNEKNEETQEGPVIEYIESELDIAYHEGQEEKVKKVIAERHEYLNELAGWGNAEIIRFEDLLDSTGWQQLKEDIKWLYEDGFAPSLVINDMLNAEQFIHVAENGDRMSVRYIHRIFHDLDAAINGADVDRVWGVTQAFGEARQQQEVMNYLNRTP
ncbi:hypothetical protein [Bacillus sp. JCM 19034]|uniref:hypothetical protein n=1 Tax=Bacillus sp. JCM 19034 TaxID=1481928 RepID=UPI0007840B1A|nr:hypothetical protein [Bacillus sp. JCM 19034]